MKARIGNAQWFMNWFFSINIPFAQRDVNISPGAVSFSFREEKCTPVRQRKGTYENWTRPAGCDNLITKGRRSALATCLPGDRDLNCRQYELLIQFLNAPGQFFPYSDLAAGAGVSVRTIRNYISSINDYLRISRLPPLETRPDASAGFCAGKEVGLKVRNMVLSGDFYRFRLSPSERRTVIVLMLLSGDEYLTLFALSRLLFVSKGTLLKDLEDAEAYLSSNGAALSPLRNKGYKLELPESLRRSLLYHLVLPLIEDSFRIIKPANILYQFAAGRLQLAQKEAALQSAVADIEARFGMQMDDAAFTQLVLYLNIWAERVSGGHLIGEDGTAKSAPSSISGLMSSHFADTIEAALSMRIPGCERRYLASILDEFGLFPGNQDGDMTPEIASKGFLIALSEAVSLPLAADAELHMTLCAQIKKSLLRTGKPRQADPYWEEYIRQYPQIYREYASRLPSLGKFLGICIGEDEASHLFVHIITAVERYYNKQGAPQIIIVCDSGNGTAMFLTEKLRRRFNVNVVKAAPVRRLTTVLQDYPCDLLVSTVPLEVEQPWLQVSPALHSQDIIRLHAALDACVPSRHTCASAAGVPSDSSLRFLHRSLMSVNCPAASWEEAIACAGNLLVETGRASTAYVQAMIQAVHKNGPYIVFAKGAALAHAECEAGFSGFAFSLVRLAEPVPFDHPDNDPVQYVAAVHTPGGRRFSKALFTIMDILCDMDLRIRLDSSADGDEMYHTIAAHIDMRTRFPGRTTT